MKITLIYCTLKRIYNFFFQYISLDFPVIIQVDTSRSAFYRIKIKSIRHADQFAEFSNRHYHILSKKKNDLNHCFQDNDYNVLLFGETGSGKSTFMNACEFYLKYPTLSEALNSKQILCPTPMKFTWQGEDYTDRLVEFVSDTDQNHNVIDESAIQSLRVHNFVYEGNRFNLIDTPSFGDTEGCLADTENAKKIVEFLENRCQNLHAVCIVLKLDEDWQDLSFRYNVKQMLSLLHKDMLLGNLILVVTHSSAGNFRLGSAYSVFRKTLGDVGDAIILKNNTFFIDNKCLTHLLAVNLKIDSGDPDNIYSDCWNDNRKSYLELFQRIPTLKPRSVDQITQVSVLRTTLEDLCCQQLPQIKANIHQHQTQLQENETIIQESQECIQRITLISESDAKVRAYDGHFYYLICQNNNCQKSDIYGESGKACGVNCSAWIGSWDSVFDSRGKCEMCGCSNYEHKCIYKPLLEEKEKCNDELIDSLLERANHNVVLAMQREDKVLRKFDKDTIEHEQIQSDIKNYVELLKECCFVPYSEECIEQIKTEIEIKESNKELKNYLKEYEQLYDICMHNYYCLLG